MALIIEDRPKGYILDSTEVACPGQDDGVGHIIFVVLNHGLVDGDIVYMSTEIEDYNGFFVVATFGAPSNFYIRDLSTSSSGLVVNYVNDAPNATFIKSVSTHGVNAVHLPITYRISNNLYPTNSVDSTQVVTSLSNNSGFAQIGLDGSLGTFEDLSFVKISGANDEDLNGVWQIIDKISTTSVILNLAYESVNGAGILGASIQLYYGNYNIVVNVYAGINASHEWQSQKPYELAATLELIPDSNNEVFFSINDILKAYVSTENNLLLSTLPNNIDAWTNFYIETAEQYDSSNGYTVITNEGGFTSDLSNFEGMAINAKLAFKNIHSGSMSAYIINNSASKFLTLFERPVLFSGSYQDISWLKMDSLPVTLKKEWLISGGIALTEMEEYDNDAGVFRTELEASCNYDSLLLTGIVNNIVSQPNFTRITAGSQSLTADLFIPAGQAAPGTYTYTVQLAPTVTLGDQATAIFTYLYADGTSLDFATITRTTVGVTNGVAIALPTPVKSVIGLRLSALIIDAPATTLNASIFVLADITSAQFSISETKQIDINCECSDQDLRLSWKIYPAGFDYWSFTAQKGHAIDITEAGETVKNIFPNWPNSYGEFADTIRKQTNRTSIIKQFVTSQYLTQDQADGIAFIKSSPLVQIVNSRQDRRTVIVDTDSFLKYTDGDKTFTISFNILYTDDIPSQSV